MARATRRARCTPPPPADPLPAAGRYSTHTQSAAAGAGAVTWGASGPRGSRHSPACEVRLTQRRGETGESRGDTEGRWGDAEILVGDEETRMGDTDRWEEPM